MRTTDALMIGMALGRIRATLDAWEESKHPRRPDGKFGKGGGTSNKSSGEKSNTVAAAKFSDKQKKIMSNTLKSQIFKKTEGSNEEISKIASNQWGYAGISNEKMAKMLSAYDPKYEYTIEQEKNTGHMGKFTKTYLVRTPKK